MQSIRSSQGSRFTVPVLIAVTVLSCLFGIAAWADEHIVQPVNGVYSDGFTANEVLIKYQDLCNGSLHLVTGSVGYTDDFYVTAGSFSGWHAADACPLTRDIGVAGGDSTWQGGGNNEKNSIIGCISWDSAGAWASGDGNEVHIRPLKGAGFVQLHHHRGL